MSVEDDVHRLEEKVESMGQQVAVTASQTSMILDEMKQFRKAMQAEADRGRAELVELGKMTTYIESSFKSHEKHDDQRFAELKQDSKVIAKKSAGWITAAGGVIIAIIEFLGHSAR